MLSKFRLYICFLFLWIFWIPQISNALHFALLHHEFGLKEHSGHEWMIKKDIHYCDQCLFDVPLAILTSGIDIPLELFIDFYKTIDLTKFIFFSFSFLSVFLRGPPLAFNDSCL